MPGLDWESDDITTLKTDETCISYNTQVIEYEN